jgi:hypothetical protein
MTETNGNGNAANGTNNDNRMIGAFVTNKWLVGAMLMVIMSMGGYIFRGIDKSGDAQATTLTSVTNRVVVLETDVAVSKATQTAQYLEIIRRLDRMETYLYGSTRPLR